LPLPRDAFRLRKANLGLCGRNWYDSSSMDTTSPTLLLRVRDRNDESAWNEFVGLYTPILIHYGKSRGLAQPDAEDVAQECMQSLLSVMSEFEYSRSKGSFKNYLFTIATNKIRNRFRRRQPTPCESVVRALAQEAVGTDEHDWDRIWARRHLEYCLERVAQQFSNDTIAAFNLYALEDWPIEEVCRTLGLTANQVYLAKSRVTKRLRKEWTEVIGDTD